MTEEERMRRTPIRSNLPPVDTPLPPPLHATLFEVATHMAHARDPWWIIASAAMALHGATPIEVADVDLLASERDAGTLVEVLGLSPAPPGGTPRFRSALFARWESPPLPVEIMAGFQVRTPQGWHSIRPTTRLPVTIDGATLFIPSVTELIAHCRLFDRPKDRERATILQRHVDDCVRPATGA
jgi:hypothetical protein